MSEWQPMKTVPRDGATPVLVHCRTPLGPRILVAQIIYWEGDNGNKPGQWCLPIDRGFVALDYPPTHWMPLPEPPK